MKLIHKMILGFILIILFIWIVEYFAVNTSKKALRKSIETSSLLIAVKVMDEIDKDLYRRIEETQLFANNLVLQKAVLVSNRAFEHMRDFQEYINAVDQRWTSAPKELITPFMQQIIDNDISKQLREKIEYYKNKYGYDIFGEIIVTNKYGANIGQTGKTTDYRQDDEEWWQIAKKDRFYIHDIGFDESAGIYSIDFGIRIDDKEGNFIGAMKVILNVEEAISIIRGPELAEMQTEHTQTKWMLLTKDGRLIYSTGDFQFLSRISDDLLSHFKKEQKGFFIAESNSQRKREKLITFAHSNYRKLDWILIVEHDAKEIFAPITKLQNGIILIALFVTVFAILTGFLFYNAILKPVTKLRDAALEIGKGNLDTKIEIESKDPVRNFYIKDNDLIVETRQDRASISKADR